MREWEIDPADIRLGEKVGEGEFGTVFKVRPVALSEMHVRMQTRTEKEARCGALEFEVLCASKGCPKMLPGLMHSTPRVNLLDLGARAGGVALEHRGGEDAEAVRQHRHERFPHRARCPAEGLSLVLLRIMRSTVLSHVSHPLCEWGSDEARFVQLITVCSGADAPSEPCPGGWQFSQMLLRIRYVPAFVQKTFPVSYTVVGIDLTNQHPVRIHSVSVPHHRVVRSLPGRVHQDQTAHVAGIPCWRLSCHVCRLNAVPGRVHQDQAVHAGAGVPAGRLPGGLATHAGVPPLPAPRHRHGPRLRQGHDLPARPHVCTCSNCHLCTGSHLTELWMTY